MIVIQSFRYSLQSSEFPPTCSKTFRPFLSTSKKEYHFLDSPSLGDSELVQVETRCSPVSYLQLITASEVHTALECIVQMTD